ncbi:MAG: hypothetical protein HFE73_04190 [Firmicutes bacterium]|jgi:hypothetical protein|nr:hypothetical protein [Bacillota bacterium]
MNTYNTKPKGSRYQDLTGRRFGRLIVLEQTNDRATDGSICWLCRCNCGNLTTTNSNKLLQGRTISCGCYSKEQLRSSRSYIGGTCLEIVRSKKIPANNTSGIKNVSRNRDKWIAKISFAHKQFFLGRYEDINTATAIAKAAEEIRDNIIDQIDLLQDTAVDVFSAEIAELLEQFRAQT